MSQTPADRGVHHFIRAAADGAVGRIVIDNAEARNGITADSCRMIAKAIDAFDADASVRVIALSGAGGHFCSGADLRQGPKILAGTDDDLHDRVRDGFHSAVEALHRCNKPTVALIRGACVGFGFDLALSCDLRLAANESKIGQVAPLARWQTNEDIAEAICFLASDAAKNITGQTLNVDGGQVMHS